MQCLTERAASSQQMMTTGIERVILVGIPKKNVRLRKGLKNEESTDGSWKVCSHKILCDHVKMCVVAVSKALVTKLRVKDLRS
jgi:hypothetical protein